MKMRLILGDQLNLKHSWYSTIDEQTLYVMYELNQEASYVVHHIQKIVAFFSAMQSFAANLRNRGHQVLYFDINTNESNKSLKEKSKIYKKQNNYLKETNFDNEKFKNNPKDLSDLNENISVSNFAPIDSFFEIAPIDYEMDNSSRKELSSVPLSEVDFPKVVYMIVDKKIELEIKLLKDFPEWEFLPHDDLNRKTIEIFFDLNLAKRSCNKEQKVLKVPNTDVFRIASPVLIAKGISRIVCAENLIAI